MITTTDYRAAMARFASGVTIVTTADPDDHTILIARVDEVQLRRGGMPAAHVDRRYWDLVPR